MFAPTIGAEYLRVCCPVSVIINLSLQAKTNNQDYTHYIQTYRKVVPADAAVQKGCKAVLAQPPRYDMARVLATIGDEPARDQMFSKSACAGLL
jgi:hypothetical protein|tara:strand:- start:201 stop:482 length:282 start_codon:yes stop_codon:yes gene_type:complete